MELLRAYDPELHKKAAHEAATKERPGIAQLEREMPWKTSRRFKGVGPPAKVNTSKVSATDGFARRTRTAILAEGAESRQKGPQRRAASMLQLRLY